MCAYKRNDKYEVCSYPTGTLYKFYSTKRILLTFVAFCPWAFPYRRKREVWISISPHAFLHKGRGFNLLMSTLFNSNISCTGGWPWKLKIVQAWTIIYSTGILHMYNQFIATSAPPRPPPPPTSTLHKGGCRWGVTQPPNLPHALCSVFNTSAVRIFSWRAYFCLFFCLIRSIYSSSKEPISFKSDNWKETVEQILTLLVIRKS